MRVREKNNLLNFLKKVFIDVDYPDGEEIDIGRSEDPEMKDLRESLDRVGDLERSFYVSNSSPKGGKSNSIVEKAEVNTTKAMEAAEKKEVRKEQQVEKEK